MKEKADQNENSSETWLWRALRSLKCIFSGKLFGAICSLLFIVFGSAHLKKWSINEGGYWASIGIILLGIGIWVHLSYMLEHEKAEREALRAYTLALQNTAKEKEFCLIKAIGHESYYSALKTIGEDSYYKAVRADEEAKGEAYIKAHSKIREYYTER